MNNIPTPHIEAKQGDIAETVLMPGDPLRAKFIAETFLENASLYNSVRGMLGFTGVYKGVRVSVQGSGMGIPSMGIYSHELFNFYEVKNIIRVGTAGGIHEDLHIKDLVIAMGACTNSNYPNSAFKFNGSYAPIASYNLIEAAVKNARQKNLRFMVGNILASDTFYSDRAEDMAQWRELNVLAVEMESAALFMNAARFGKNALSILTISDCIFTGESTTSSERQSAFTDMMEVALDTAIEINNK